MGFFGNIISSTIKIGLTPLAIIKDGVDILSGEEPENTKNLIDSSVDDAAEALSDLDDGEI